MQKRKEEEEKIVVQMTMFSEQTMSVAIFLELFRELLAYTVLPIRLAVLTTSCNIRHHNKKPTLRGFVHVQHSEKNRKRGGVHFWSLARRAAHARVCPAGSPASGHWWRATGQRG